MHMAIDVSVPFSHGWWMKKLAEQQANRLPHLESLHRRYIGQAPNPEGPIQGRPAYAAFQKLARTTYEDTIVRAVLDRQTPTAFRTAAADDEGGDKRAHEVWAANEMPVAASEILEHKLSMGVGYAMVGPPGPEDDGIPVITPEDPRLVITAHDPVRKSRVRAGLKVFFDADAGLEVAYVAVRGTMQSDGTMSRATVRRAQRKARQSSLTEGFRLSPRGWDWVKDETWSTDVLELATTAPPFVRFQNRGGMAEFEKHIDLIDRIRHTILQRMVIITMQAYRQRAVKGMPDRYPDNYAVAELRGQVIDYEGVFTNDPAAVWLLPEMAQMWESGDLNLVPVLDAVRSDIRELAAVSRTPFTELMPDNANQSAEGATVAKEGITFKVEDHNTTDGISFAHTMGLAFEQMGDTERAKRSAIETIWAPVDRYSLIQKADASAKAKGIRSHRRILTDIWQLTPQQADEELDELADDFLMAATQTAVGDGDPAAGPRRVESTRADQPAPDGTPAIEGTPAA